MNAKPIRCQSISDAAMIEIQKDRQLWQLNGFTSGRLKLWRALANPIGSVIIIR